MLWVNGYSGKAAQLLGLVPPAGRAYWGKNLNAAGHLLKDWHWMFIDPDMSFLSTPAQRFKTGYDFAMENERIIKNNMLINGNLLQIVAHGKGVAFAEGIAAYFYEEKGIVTDMAIYIQGSQLSVTPQSRRSVDCRIEFASGKNKKAIQRNTLKYKDLLISEEDLLNGFCKYAIKMTARGAEPQSCELYFRGAIEGNSKHSLLLKKPVPLWSSIDQALKMYVESEVDAYSGRVENVRNVMFERHILN